MAILVVPPPGCLVVVDPDTLVADPGLAAAAEFAFWPDVSVRRL
jgi:hypothetical protein